VQPDRDTRTAPVALVAVPSRAAASPPASLPGRLAGAPSRCCATRGSGQGPSKISGASRFEKVARTAPVRTGSSARPAPPATSTPASTTPLPADPSHDQQASPHGRRRVAAAGRWSTATPASASPRSAVSWPTSTPTRRSPSTATPLTWTRAPRCMRSVATGRTSAWRPGVTAGWCCSKPPPMLAPGVGRVGVVPLYGRAGFGRAWRMKSHEGHGAGPWGRGPACRAPAGPATRWSASTACRARPGRSCPGPGRRSARRAR
jgi:hypothetical protein